jgi:hypothetical protein
MSSSPGNSILNGRATQKHLFVSPKNIFFFARYFNGMTLSILYNLDATPLSFIVLVAKLAKQLLVLFG